MNNALQQQVTFCADLATSYNKELNLYTQCIDLLLSQIRQIDEENDTEDHLESLSSQIRMYQDLYTKVESQYFNACADLWIARAELTAMLETE